MEPTQEKLNAQVKQLEQALRTLAEALAMPKTSIVRDSVIKRFEYVYELSWKCMKTAGKFKGLSIRTPRDAMRAAFQSGLISDPQPWFEMLQTRNEIVHTYQEEFAEKVYQVAQRLPELVMALLAALRKI